MRGSKLNGALAAALAAQAAWATPAWAAEPLHAFTLPPQPISEALIAVALKAGVSIGGADLCHGRSSGLVGRFSVEAALRRLVAGADCAIQRVDGRTFRIVRSHTASPAPRPRVVTPAAPLRIVEPSLPQPEQLDEVVITAPRRPTLSDHYPGAVSALSGAALARAGAVDGSDIFGLLAGVSMTNLGPGRDKIMVGSSRVDLQACKLEYSIVSPK